MKLLKVGEEAYVTAERIIAVSSPHAAAIKRAVDAAKEAGLLLDFTGQEATRGILILDTGVLIRIPIRAIDVENALKNLT